MVLPGILGIMTGVGFATIVAVGLLVYMNLSGQHQAIGARPAPRSQWTGYKPNDESVFCSICLERLTPLNRRELPCKHVFHAACINKWKENKEECPNCRTPI